MWKVAYAARARDIRDVTNMSPFAQGTLTVTSAATRSKHVAVAVEKYETEREFIFSPLSEVQVHVSVKKWKIFTWAHMNRKTKKCPET